ncbi:hypothetical protein LZZ85_16225 [Terrimonas sp. NA20]|uniref:Lipoprotein n=1 Tax=Terrimonas ginsenosidimutans TaxID=2908004 RepID=A0ABS9KU48_9BACT|nr:hypothetical protein [Terrimonas ginsenosidimutans]MCG2615843.1 hypothetical protein [Terrimonas ginsenosidimutans]
MNKFSITLTGVLLAATTLLFACKQKEQENKPSAISHVVSDSLKVWCKNKMPASRILEEAANLKLVFFEEELNLLWRPAYREDLVKEMADRGNFSWEELPAHEGNRRWQLSLNFQQEDSTYATPNNLLLYLFR